MLIQFRKLFIAPNKLLRFCFWTPTLLFMKTFSAILSYCKEGTQGCVFWVFLSTLRVEGDNSDSGIETLNSFRGRIWNGGIAHSMALTVERLITALTFHGLPTNLPADKGSRRTLMCGRMISSAEVSQIYVYINIHMYHEICDRPPCKEGRPDAACMHWKGVWSWAVGVFFVAARSRSSDREGTLGQFCHPAVYMQAPDL